jgi:hypothetical protein
VFLTLACRLGVYFDFDFEGVDGADWGVVDVCVVDWDVVGVCVVDGGVESDDVKGGYNAISANTPPRMKKSTAT